MKFIRLVANAITGIALVGASPHEKRSTEPYRVFNVTNFVATAVVLSHRVSYHMNISIWPDKPPLYCWNLLTSVTERLVTFEAYCDDSHTLLWAWTQFEDGSAELDVSTLPKEGCTPAWLEATRFIPANETTVVGINDLMHQVYIGPENFTMDATRVG